MTKKIFLALVFLGNTLLFGQTGRIKGKVIDAENKEELSFTNIQLEQKGKVVLNATADLSGDFLISGLAPGIYDLKAACVGYRILQMDGIIISADKTTQESVKMEPAVTVMNSVVISEALPLSSGCWIRCPGTTCRLLSCGAFIEEGIFLDSAKAEERKPAESVACTIYPNPFMETATLEISSALNITDGSIKLFDVAGKEVRSLDFSGNSVTIERKGLGAGVYMYQVSSANKTLASGRMAIQ